MMSPALDLDSPSIRLTIALLTSITRINKKDPQPINLLVQEYKIRKRDIVAIHRHILYLRCNKEHPHGFFCFLENETKTGYEQKNWKRVEDVENDEYSDCSRYN